MTYTKREMKSLLVSKSKKYLKKAVVARDIRKVSTTPSVVKSQLKRSAKNNVSYGKKIRRFAKQGVKSMLLSKAFHATFKVSVGILVSSGLVYGSYLFIGKTFANEVVVSQSEIVARVAKLTTLPQESPYEIVRVQDEEDLKKQNAFYKDIKEGDYILIYKDMAVIYDLRANTIVAMKK